MIPHLEINGAVAEATGLSAALTNYGHFTSLQVRDGGTRGIALHLQRLQSSTRALFGTELDTADVRVWLRAALLRSGRQASCSVRITVFSTAFARDAQAASPPVDVLIAIDAPRHLATTPLRVQLRDYRRDTPHIKHLGTFGLFWQRRQAQSAGFDDALFATDGCITEGSTWNVGFFDDSGVVWPRGPMLDGTTQQLLKRALVDTGIPSVERTLRLEDLQGLRGAFIANSSGVGTGIVAVDAHVFSGAADLLAQVGDAYRRIPFEPLLD